MQDSVVVSRLLLRNHGAYDPYKQIGLDMLKRLNAHEEIVDILVSRGQVSSISLDNSGQPFSLSEETGCGRLAICG